MAVGGPLEGTDSVKINLGLWINVPDFHLKDKILEFNAIAALPMK